jgi:hypothetical protein
VIVCEPADRPVKVRGEATGGERAAVDLGLQRARATRERRRDRARGAGRARQVGLGERQQDLRILGQRDGLRGRAAVGVLEVDRVEASTEARKCARRATVVKPPPSIWVCSVPVPVPPENVAMIEPFVVLKQGLPPDSDSESAVALTTVIDCVAVQPWRPARSPNVSRARDS